MSTIASLMVEIGVDPAGVGPGVDQAETKLQKFSRRAEKAGAVAGKMLAVGLAVGGAAAVKMGQKASDLSETVNKASIIFGDNYAEIDKWSKGAATSMGLSQAAALDAASGFGDMFSQLGFAGDQAAKMSKSVVQMSADLGSFNNLPTAEVTDMMSAAFRGEYDSLQRLIPNINATRVETEALEMTGKKSAKTLTAQEKAAATLAIVQKDGARAAGDFARTSDGLANSQKIATARMEDLQAKIGAKVLPAMNKLLGVGLKVIDWIDRNQRLVGILGGVLVGLTATVWAVGAAMKAWTAITAAWTAVTKAATIAQKALNFAMKMNPIGLVVTALTLLVTGLVIAYKKSETFRKIVDGAFKAVAAAGRWMWNNVLQPVFKFLVKGFATVMDWYAKMLRGLSKVPGFGWAAKAADGMSNAADKARALANDIRKIPAGKSVKINVDVPNLRAVAADLDWVARPRSSRITITKAYAAAGRDTGGGLQRAIGGHAVAGQPYEVGEHRREVFVPGVNGQILAADKVDKLLAGGGKRDVNLTVNMPTSSTAAVDEATRRMLAALESTGV